MSGGGGRAAHGTPRRYAQGCSCAKCRAAQAEYQRSYRENTDRFHDRTRNRAVREAAHRYRKEHPAEWEALLAEIRKADSSEWNKARRGDVS